ITNAWGAWKAKQLGTSLHFTASTKYGGNSHLSPYTKYEVQSDLEAGGFHFVNKRELPDGVGFDLSHTVHNSTGEKQTMDVTFTEKKTSELTISVTEAVKIGNKVSGGVNVPFFADGKVEITAELSVSSTQSWKNSKDNGLSIKVPTVVPAHSSVLVKSTWVINRLQADWVADVVMRGYVAVRFNDYVYYDNYKENGWHALWFIPIKSVFDEIIQNNIIDTTGYIRQYNSVIAQAKGTLETATTAFGKTSFSPIDSASVIGNVRYNKEEPVDYVLIGADNEEG
ncbi:ETX/MTX2 family pore-forming toxin, partial [Photorhabdus stackebrandtii]